MRILFAALLLLSFSFAYGQERSKKLVKSIESSNPEEYKRIVSDLKRTPEEVKVELGATNNTVTKSEPISSSSAPQSSENVPANSSNNSTPSPANTSAIAHGEARVPSPAVAKVYKYKADERSVEYYNELRKKFEEEEKVRKEKEAQLAMERAKKEEEIKQGRRLTEDQAPQFDRFRQGEKNPEVKKTTAEDEYKALFK